MSVFSWEVKRNVRVKRCDMLATWLRSYVGDTVTHSATRITRHRPYQSSCFTRWIICMFSATENKQPPSQIIQQIALKALRTPYSQCGRFHARNVESLIVLGLATPTPTPGLIVWQNDCVLRDDLRYFFQINKRYTIVYRQCFSCKVKNRLQQHYTKVQMRQIWPGVLVSFKWATPTPTPHPCCTPDPIEAPHAVSAVAIPLCWVLEVASFYLLNKLKRWLWSLSRDIDDRRLLTRIQLTWTL